MITFEELREKTTPNIIKQMCELAEGFSFKEGNIPENSKVVINLGDIKIDARCYDYFCTSNLFYNCNALIFSSLLHRVVEGWNKDKKGEDCIIISDDNLILWRADLDDYKVYDFKDYQPYHLTQCEMAIWDCLLNIL